MKRIDAEVIQRLSEEAKASPRLRKNLNLHEYLEDPFQRLLNAIEPFSYIQPHKHENPDKRELFFVLRGRFLLVEFDEKGAIMDHFILDSREGNYAAEVAAGVYHTFLSLEPGSVSCECKDGPYFPIDDKCFASWAPKEGEPGCRAYLEGLLQEVMEDGR